MPAVVSSWMGGTQPLQGTDMLSPGLTLKPRETQSSGHCGPRRRESSCRVCHPSSTEAHVLHELGPDLRIPNPADPVL